MESFDLLPHTRRAEWVLKTGGGINRDIINEGYLLSLSLSPSSPPRLSLSLSLGCDISNRPDCVSSDSDITATPNLLEARGEGGRIWA